MNIQVRFNRKDDCYMATCDEHKNLIGYGNSSEHAREDLEHLISKKSNSKDDIKDYRLNPLTGIFEELKVCDIIMGAI